MAPDNVSLGLAFLAGILSFASPCVLPLFPSYLSYLTGLSYEEIRAGGRWDVRSVVLLNSLFFIAGFSFVFVALGASFSFLGKALFSYQNGIRITGGILITMFGLYIGDRALDFPVQSFFSRKSSLFAGLATAAAFAGGLYGMGRGWATWGGVLAAGGLYLGSAIFWPVLSQEKRFSANRRPAGWAGSFLVGVTFAAGWTPCVGPILGSILLYAGTQETAAEGVFLLGSYSAGLGLPFLLSGLGIEYFLRFYQSVKSHFRTLELGSSVMLLTVGLLLISNYLSILSSYLIFWTGYTGI